MNQKEIKRLLASFQPRLDRTIVIIDYGNVEKWKRSLNWIIGIKELGQLVKSFSKGNKSLRRFYYGSDYGPNEKSQDLSPWSEAILAKAEMNRFEIVTKRVKYIHDRTNKAGYEKKCDFDIEIAVDLIKLNKLYDNIILFSGDGDLMYVISFLSEEYKKKCLVFGARDFVGRECFDAKKRGFVDEVIFSEDFEYRLNRARFLK